MLTVVAFIVALALLIAVHEYGHYRVAVACGVKVLRFSIGFGHTLFSWKPRRQHPGQDTEFVIAAFPLGGYVKMLDEREGPVVAEERHRAFNTQPLRSRAAIVAAGPFANLLLAVVLYTAVNWIGVEEPVARLARPVAASLAEQAGLRGGEHVIRAGFDGELEPVQSFEDLRWRITRGALDGRDLTLEIAGEGGRPARELVLPLNRVGAKDADAQMFRRIGVVAPLTRPQIGELMAGGAAERAGLRSGDMVNTVGPTAIVDGQQLRDVIRASVDAGQPRTQVWQVERGGQSVRIEVTPEVRDEGGNKVGRIGAYVGSPPEMVTVRQGVIDGIWRGLVRTWEVSALTVRMMGKMLIGEASIKNLSGPLTIADYAGKSASLGLTQYLVFLALISVSLGVLNLMPLPVLDGGHLMYYLWEGLTGRSVSDAWMERLQRGGVALLLVMMSIAIFNDVTRLFG
ncbi:MULTISPECIES: RIP metalloprotease RseP [unclassified Variovorax]|uniref:RIP metalloprotease RseP n=1 Tax=unclassified Variovorax TaxID=663243 RepID=UPI00076C7FD0|nr:MULTISPECIES: RIP metalloprotease RseP [unclassified Variovorax]KWT85196.1 Membrane-associated zinc metalloprotease [Variovorax sp. WDL1]PNG56630.1 Regulator of sigma-E protease RseP [Variovorax sp. B4]PNG58054.1 Regulator of sigma-E protease RseP [Variovorax sp. B2]VTV09459.1 Regulator of sigma E protease [Variovorax sp. WDL1]